MKRLSLALLVLQLLSPRAHANFGDTPSEILTYKCYRIDDQVVFVQTREGDGPESVSVGKSKTTSKASLEADCEKAKKNLVLKDVEESAFKGVVGSLVFLSEAQTTQNYNGVRVYSMEENGLSKRMDQRWRGMRSGRKDDLGFEDFQNYRNK